LLLLLLLLLLCRLSYSLESVDLSNNAGVTGQLPPELGLLARFSAFNGLNTSMSCAGAS
jgi:hypothetical protein